MRIDSSNIGMESGRVFSSVSRRSTKLTIMEQSLTDGTGGLFGDLLQPKEENTGEAEDDKKDYLTKTMEEMQAKLSARTSNLTRLEEAEPKKQLRSIRQQCLDYLLDLLLYGKWNKRMDQNSCFGEEGGSSSGYGTSLWALASQNKGANVKTFVFSDNYYYAEEETASFSTEGTVRCADGRELSFNLNLQMSRRFEECYEEAYAAVDVSLCDPLVINLDGNIPELSDQTFFFDIDQDGEKDEISSLASGNAFLALDKNEDGEINDGGELFGTRSGNGFRDLAAYDEDQNGFIDEGDAIFEKLKIWAMNEEGEMVLYSLKDKDIGAIALQNAETQFSHTDKDNGLLGMVRRSGFFLYENGTAGSIQQVDLAKYSEAI